MILLLPYSTFHESVLKHEAGRLLRSIYAPISEISVEMLKWRRSGHEFCHLVGSEDSQEDGQVLNSIFDTG